MYVYRFSSLIAVVSVFFLLSGCATVPAGVDADMPIVDPVPEADSAGEEQKIIDDQATEIDQLQSRIRELEGHLRKLISFAL